jgi:hypothetical protein
LRKQRPGLNKAVGHLILAPGPEDRELTKEEWRRALLIALEAHGAAAAPHAAWLHADTDHKHLHVFFSRVTPAGDVISDSNSFQKNRTATKIMTKELNLTPLPDESKSDVPGDRQAAENATRRAERIGEAQIDPKEVRAVLAEAASLEDCERRLLALGIEAEFQRRGQEQNVYGWKLRRAGAGEWVKASTLSKDLSWPKIAHRFPDADHRLKLAELPASVHAEKASTAPTREAGALALRPSHQDRRPSMLRYPAPAERPEARRQRLVDLRRIEDRDLGPLQKSLLVLAGALANVSLELLRKVMGWLAAVLRKLGFQIQPVEQLHPAGPQALAYAASPFSAAPLALGSPDDPQVEVAAAAQTVLAVAEAVSKRDADLLPAGEGRSEVAAAIAAEFMAPAAPVPGPQAPPQAQQAGAPGVPAVADELKQLEQCAAAHRNAYMAHQTSAGRVSHAELDRLAGLSQQSRRKVLLQFDRVQQIVRQRAGQAMTYAPTRDGAKRLLASAGLLRDRLQLFCGMPTRDRFFEALEPFKQEEKRFEDLLKLHPLPVVQADDEAGSSGFEAGRADADMLDPDVRLQDGFEAPRG